MKKIPKSPPQRNSYHTEKTIFYRVISLEIRITTKQTLQQLQKSGVRRSMPHSLGNSFGTKATIYSNIKRSIRYNMG